MKPQKVIRDKCVGHVLGESRTSHTPRDSIIYALGVGCSQDPLNDIDLAYTYEQHGDGFKVIPSFATTFPSFELLLEGLQSCPGLPEFNPMMLLHGQQKVTLFRPLAEKIPRMIHRSIISDVEDKKSGALVTVASDSTCEKTGALICRNESMLFIRGLATDQPSSATDKRSAEDPRSRAKRQKSSVSFQGPPSKVFDIKTPENLALLYRLSGDTNPLHVDRQMAALGGFKRPILHGLCTFGIATRAIIQTLLENDPDRVASVSGRFSAAVTPGDELRVQMWISDAEENAGNESAVLFNVVNRTKDDQVCLEKGILTVRSPGPQISKL
ncbi:putative peroxisomal multifunctional enzyme [Neospora caninum Liverpool]|uniref:Peroxisomal multifunctional enzyme, putative n=1 Tax=Neospora caninum (strain Liverpool) TaxID=572307 RepID=F0VJZ1_NEOCL|nr:putative peroxisomal multifunctional enzyme [Neospora caninum Liverpool]CBZ53221.1 putative peroxisomal multifunctional enzyme [Neospora caninum Liverpool]CEL67211.1 TPA: peroxisomal multifunctional enzyme, putative [Neospora caninum Liverpool]|eukprot:XP_003883253.1 putative peroxisomal multifunctional enzyme [Neospora caninum Liverpool]